MATTPSRKRKATDVDEWDVSEVREAKGAVVHGMVTHLSPIKTSRKNPACRYFDLNLTDGKKKTLRGVSFNPSLRRIFEDLKADGASVCISNCEVRGEEKGNEIVMTNKTVVEASGRKYAIDSTRERVTRMEELANLAVGQECAVEVKVVQVGDVEKVISKKRGGELRKQDCVVGDVSGSGRVVLWEEDVGKLLEGKSYTLGRATVSMFDGTKYLSVGVYGEIVEVNDIGDIAEVDCGDVDAIVPCKTVKGEIEGVEYYEEYVACLGCNAKLVTTDDVVGECSKCGMVMKMKRGVKKMAARVIVCCDVSGDMCNVTLFDDVIVKVVEGVEGSDVKRRLLAAPTLSFKVDKRSIAISVSKV